MNEEDRAFYEWFHAQGKPYFASIDTYREAFLAGRASKKTNPGHVTVMDTTIGKRELFTGVLAETQPPYAGWHRVIPDNGYIDLPPRYDIREITE